MLLFVDFCTNAASRRPTWLAHDTRTCPRLAAVCGALTVLVLLACSTARAEERGHELTASFGKGVVTEPHGVAVNEVTGAVYVADHAQGKVDIFNAKHELSGEINGSGLLPTEEKAAGSGNESWERSTGQFSEPTGIAVDNGCHLRKLSGSQCEEADPSNGDVYILDAGHFVIDKYTAAGKYIGQITRTPEGGDFERNLAGVATGTDGTVSVGALIGGAEVSAEIFTFSSALQNGCDSCVVRSLQPFFRGGTILAFLGADLAVGAKNEVYVHAHFIGQPDIVVEYSEAGSSLREIHEIPGGLAVEESTDDLFLAAANQLTRYNSAGTAIEQIEVAGLNPVGVAVDGITGEVLVSDQSNSEVDVFGLEAPKAPSIRNTTVEDVSAEEAVFTTEINPRGAQTTYQIEYGQCVAGSCASTPYEHALPSSPGIVGDSFESFRVRLPAEGLNSGSAYHIRTVAKNAVGTSTGEELLFSTRRVGRSGLLDGRQWEQLSPISKLGALIWPIGENGVVQAAANGEAITYSVSNPTESSPEGFSNAVQVMSARAPGGGWSTQDLALPHSAPTGKSTALGQEYRFFSEDLTLAIAQPFGPFAPVSDAASEQTAYVHSDFAPDSPSLCSKDCYRPLVTGCPEVGVPCPAAVSEAADVPAGTKFELTGAACESAKVCGPVVRATSPDLSAVLLEGRVALTEEGSPGLYEWVGGRLHFIGGKLPESGAEATAFVADGGARAVLGSTKGASPLRMVDPLSGEEAQVDEGTGCVGCQSGGGEMAWASKDARTVLFRDKRRLTGPSGAGLGDLYVCEAPVSEIACALTDLTPKVAGEEADVLGIVAASQSGDTVYFVADSALGTSAPRGDCGEGESEQVEEGKQCNLFVMRRGSSGWEAPTLIGVLSEGDEQDWRVNLTRHTASLSENGQWLVFMSKQRLTGYDNRDATSDQPDEEVYAYNSASATGALTCVSCNPTGERPSGLEYRVIEERLAGGPHVWEGRRWLAANIPGWTPFRLGDSAHDARLVNDAGRVFFNAADSLVAGDGNSAEDVYEWEPSGVGSCNGESVAFGTTSGGCVGLVSSGTSGQESGLVDASASGDDVFFLSFAPLTEAAGASSLALYDAHVCSQAVPCGSSQPAKVLECASVATCQGPAPAGAGGGFAGFPTEQLAPGALLTSEPTPSTKPRPLTKAQLLARALRNCRKNEHRVAKKKTCERKARSRYASHPKTPAKKQGHKSSKVRP
jgi:DNA-binding beta-propeller fold protein YncE